MLNEDYEERDVEIDVSDGTEELDFEDFEVPRINLVQKSSKEGTAGNFRDTFSGKEFDELEVVISRVSKSRARRSEDLDEGIICESRDGKVSLSDEPCEDCPHALWENNEPPRCRIFLNFLCTKHPEPYTFMFSVHGTSFKPAKRYTSTLVSSNKKLYSVLTKITSQETSNDYGKFFVVQFETVRDLEPDELNVVMKLASKYAQETITQDVEENENGLGDVKDFATGSNDDSIL